MARQRLVDGIAWLWMRMDVPMHGVEMSMDNVLRSWIAKGMTKYCIEISLSHNAVALVFVCGRYFHPLSAMGMPH
jgi:hypothetical protein